MNKNRTFGYHGDGLFTIKSSFGTIVYISIKIYIKNKQNNKHE